MSLSIQAQKEFEGNCAAPWRECTYDWGSRAKVIWRADRIPEVEIPILPVFAYRTADEAIEHVRRNERPLALYWFGRDRAERDRVLRDTHAGGVTLNDWGWHALNHDLPFGGTGASGIGNYHGEEGFRELSHAKSVFAEHRWFPVELFHPPYGRLVQRAVLRWYFGAHAQHREHAEAAGDVTEDSLRI